MDPTLAERTGHPVLSDQSANPKEEGLNPKTTGQRALGLTRTYAADWKVPDALRELYQNWKDAILQRHQLSLLDFVPRVSAARDHITITVEDERPLPADREGAKARQVLGYIRFNKVRESAEFTNFGATLDQQCLELGHTTKKQDHRLAGGHGEGLKIAALVLCRENHHIKISANGIYWNFGFNGQSKANFFCRLTPAKEKREPSAPASTGNSAKLSAKIWEDVSVIIEKGKRGRPLSIRDFGAWMRDTVDLHPPSGRIRTPSGDLLLEPMYQGHLYLKGIRVPEPSLDGQALRFGYNMIHGSVDRDRQRLVDSRQVTESIHVIWESAIAKEEAMVLPRYLELFRVYPSSVDVRGADRLVSEMTAQKMWAALSYESKLGDAFYCSESRKSEDYPIIRSELKKEPRSLPNLLWKVLRQYRLVRDPMEELHSRFENSKEIELPSTAFAQGVARTLHALLALHSSTRRTNVIFVRCETLAVDVAYRTDQDILYVHEKWLGSPDICPDREPSTFIGQDVVKELHCRAMKIIFREAKSTRSNVNLRELLQTFHDKLLMMPRMIRVTPMGDEKTVMVSFYTGHSRISELFGPQVHYMVALHRSDCTTETADQVYDASRDVCNCPRQVVPLSSRTAIFNDVGGGPWVPIIAKMPDDSALVEPHEPQPTIKAEDGALVGIPPQTASRQELRGASKGTANHCTASAVCPPTLPAATDKAIALNAVKSVAAVSPLNPEDENRVALTEDTVKTASIGKSPSSDLFQTTAQTSAERLVAVASPLPSTTADCGNQMVPDYRKTETGHTDGICKSDDGASSLSQQALSLIGSASADVPAESEMTRCQARMVCDGPTTITHDAHNPAFGLPAPTNPQCMGRRDTVWWKTWQEQAQEPGDAIPMDNWSGSKANGTFQPCVESLRALKGSYIQVRLKGLNNAGRETSRHVLYIHNIQSLTDNMSPSHLVVTKYSFLADHPIFGRGDTAVRDTELLLHFQDVDRMAEEDDAQIIDVDDVEAVEMAGAFLTVAHVSQTPDPVTGFFTRYGIRDGSWLESLFVTPLGPGLFGTGDKYPLPRFSPLPVASVFDLSPEEPGFSAGFAQVGYRIRAAIGFDKNSHQRWKEQHPDAAVYQGSAASVIADLDSRKLALSGLGDSEAPHVVIISGASQICRPAENGLRDADLTKSPPEYVDQLEHCSRVAQSPALSPDFIVLNLSHLIFHEGIPGPLAATVSLLLEDGYSVTLKTLSLGDPDRYEGHSVLLLATPCGTKPQWIDDTISDLQAVSNAVTAPERNTGTYAPATRWTGDSSPEEVGLDRSTQITSVPAPANSIPVTGSVQSEEADAVAQDRLSQAGSRMANEPLHQIVARQVATAISRIIGEFSKGNQRVACSPAEIDFSDQRRAKKQKI